MKKTALMIMILMILSKISGLLREVVLSYFYGAGDITDAYFIAQTVPRIVFRFMGAAIAAAFIPLFTKINNNEGKDSANKFLSNILNLSIIISGVVVLLTVLFPKQVVFIFASGFDGQQLDHAISFTRILIFSLFFLSFIHITRSFLHIKKNFWLPAVAGIPLNLLIMISIALSTKFHPSMMAVGYTIGTFVQSLLFLPFLLKSDFSYSMQLSLKDNNLRIFLITIIPITISVGINDINEIITQNIASHLVSGSVSAFKYAKNLNAFIQGTVLIGITTAMFPLISKMAVDRNIKGLKQTLHDSVNMTVLIVVPASVGALFFTREIVLLVYGRGEFLDGNESLTIDALFFLAFGILPIGLKQVFHRAFYSLNDTKTPLFIAVVAVILHITFNLLFFFYTDLGVGGLALATSLAAFISIVLFIYLMYRKVGNFEVMDNVIVFIKVLLASIIMALLMVSLMDLIISYTNLTDNIVTVIIVVIAIPIYVFLTLLFKVHEVRELFEILYNKILSSFR